MKKFRAANALGLGLSTALLLFVISDRSWNRLRPTSLTAARGEVEAASSILLITLDTTRADRLEPYGAVDVETPALDRLAREGLLFEQAFAVAPITLVAHASLFTGAYPPEHGVRNNGRFALGTEWLTLAEVLSNEGFRTAAFVASPVLEARYGLEQGFELYDDGGFHRSQSAGASDRPAGEMTDRAMAWLDQVATGDKFFVWVHYFDPHAPYAPPEPYRSRYVDRPYDGEIAYLDSEIGRLLGHHRLGAEQKLATVVIGDHGESLGDHGELTHGLLPYDSTLRIPWIIKSPGTRPGERLTRAVDQVDLFPTVLSLFGMEEIPGLPGNSLLIDGTQSNQNVRSLYAETYVPYYTYGWSKLRALRRGSIKYIEGSERELYDLEKDPGELTNLLPQESALGEKLQREMTELFKPANSQEIETSLRVDAKTTANLRSLGYFGGLGSSVSRRGRNPRDLIAVHVKIEAANQKLVSGELAEAIAQLEEVLIDDPGNLRGLSDLATAQALSGMLRAAIGTVERAVALAPDSAQLLLQLAAFEEERNQTEAALEYLSRALEIDPNYLECRLEKSLLLVRLRRQREARRLLDETIEKYPGHPEVNALYAIHVDLWNGETVLAERRLENSLESDPSLVVARIALADLLQGSDRSEQAERVLRDGLVQSTESGDLHAGLGLLLAEEGQEPTAAIHLKRALNLGTARAEEVEQRLGRLHPMPHSVAARDQHENLGQQERLRGKNLNAVDRYRRGEHDQAIQELEALVAEAPEFAPGYVNLAWIALEERRWDRAVEISKRALALDPASVRSWVNLGRAYEGQGHFEDAENAWRRALSIDPKRWQTSLNLAVLLARKGQIDEAIRELDRVANSEVSNLEAQFELARLHEQLLRDLTKARLHYEAVVELDARDPLAQEALRKLNEMPK